LATFFACARSISQEEAPTQTPTNEPEINIHTTPLWELPDALKTSIIDTELLVTAVKVDDGYLMPGQTKANIVSVIKYDSISSLLWEKNTLLNTSLLESTTSFRPETTAFVFLFISIPLPNWGGHRDCCAV
jgi:hypothetical protein